MTTGPPPRIIFNALALHPRGSGVQTYEREFLRAVVPFAPAADLQALVQEVALGELPPGVRPIVRQNTSGMRRAISGLRSPGPCDLFHGLDIDLPARTKAATVTTVYDMAVFDVPWTFPRHRVIGERVLVTAALKRADAVVAISNFTAERVRERFGRESVVVGAAPSSDMRPPTTAEVESLRSAYSLPEHFVLHVGSVEPRKDVHGLARACRAAGVPLVLAGSVVNSSTPPADAIRIGYVARSSMPALYGAATVVAYPSRYEGFGLPAVEAMACGAPVVASRIPPLADTLGDAAFLVAVGDEGALTAALGELFADANLRCHLSAKGRQVAASLTWAAVAKATVAVYDSLGVIL
jgi:glycosyltransferase involved in cell wall biosynthesis